MKKLVFILGIISIVLSISSCKNSDLNEDLYELENNNEIHQVDREKIERPGDQGN